MILWTHNDFLSRRIRYPVWSHCCKRPNYDFWISEGSVATVFRWGGQHYSHLRQFSSLCCVPKIIKIGQRFTELFKKWHWHIFFWDTRCTYVNTLWTWTDFGSRLYFELPVGGISLAAQATECIPTHFSVSRSVCLSVCPLCHIRAPRLNRSTDVDAI